MFEEIKDEIKKSLESKRENDAKRLLQLLRDNPNKFLSSKEWSEIFNRPVPSTRRNLAGLQANDEIYRLGKKGTRGVKYGFRDIDTGVWYKKILKTGETKNPKKSTKGYIEIHTFENNDDDRYQSLLSAALNGLLGDLDSIDNAGYSSTAVSVIEVDPLYITDFSIDNADGSWGNLTVYDWKNSNTGRVELYEA